MRVRVLTLSCNFFVRVFLELLLPALKYAPRVAFLRQDPAYIPFGEGLSVYEFAEQLDAGWNRMIARESCSAICTVYQLMLELLLRLLIETHSKQAQRTTLHTLEDPLTRRKKQFWGNPRLVHAAARRQGADRL